ncbi:hypothetical protein NUW58_g5624 [Xylaria curta]|uniref:Uncharacterized protein n=1 Tax=Xylaria curta TaxID=42375 RepID=A0ACC1P0Q8_9PEZI|nr:hypothetical protein NUW58_g5624 [Xylaria curta]
MDKSYPICGIPTSHSSIVPVRHEIDAWYEEQCCGDRIQLTLFILAWEELQKMDYHDKLSYFRIAGVHAAPYATWDDGQPPRSHEESYCVHNKITFPTWHRVYLLLFEQRLHEVMIEIINKRIPGHCKKDWTKAACEWRLPYWDFALLRDLQKLSLPRLCMTDKVDIILFHHDKPVKTCYNNPIYKFTTPIPMGKLDPPFAVQATVLSDEGLTYSWDKCTATTKYGLHKGSDFNTATDHGQHVEKSNLALNVHPWLEDNEGPKNPNPRLQSLRHEVQRLFTYDFTAWGCFASTIYGGKGTPPTDFLSLEFIHNNIHAWVGGIDVNNTEDPRFYGAGHMGDVPVAAFDPIFFLYHANIDRLTAIYQALYHDKWFNELQPGDPSPTASLEPFNWRCWGYGYDIVKKPGTNENRGKNKIKKLVMELYGSPPCPLSDRGIDYVINVVYDRYALEGCAYTIYFFLSKTQKLTRENCVGSVYTFSSRIPETPNATGCSACQEQKNNGVLSAAHVPITHCLSACYLRANSGLTSLNLREVDTYVQQRLHWTIVKADGTTVPLKDPRFATLQVTSCRGEIYSQDDGICPGYRGYEDVSLDQNS